MAFEKTRLTDRSGFEIAMRNGPNTSYVTMFGASLNSIFKPFTTQFAASGYPRYKISIFAVGGSAYSGSQFTGADASGLNPFGINTLYEGIVHGTTPPTDLESSVAAATVRTYGLKTPLSYIGWGFDQFGYPSPNSQIHWHTSGSLSSTGPNSTFAASGFAGAGLARGNLVPYTMWNAGPMDLRWDINKKVWTGNTSVYAAQILTTYSSGISISNYNTPVSANSLTYDVRMYDGIANVITITGAIHVGPKPSASSYRVLPLPPSSFAFVVHAPINGKPGYGVWLMELPGTTQCTSSSATGTGEVGDPYGGSQLGYISRTNLIGDSLESEYGGTGFADYPSGIILIGNPIGSGNLVQRLLAAGTGIELAGSTGISGTLFIKISSGVLFTSGGINNSITELQGLIVPLTVGQGGTGSSTKNFVDLSTTQTASGIKNFSNGVRVPTGLFTSPGFAFTNDAKTGFYWLSDKKGIGITCSGIDTFHLGYDGSTTYHHFRIEPVTIPSFAVGDNTYAPMVVKGYNDANAHNPIQLWYDRLGSDVASVTYDGLFRSRGTIISGRAIDDSSGIMIEIRRQSGQINYTILASGETDGNYFSVNNSGTIMTFGPDNKRTTFISSSGNRSINWASGYTGGIAVEHPTNTGLTRTINVINGLITGFSDA
jgi:hypothetical protein